MIIYINRDDYSVISEARFDEIVSEAIEERLQRDGDDMEVDIISQYESPYDLYWDICKLGFDGFKNDIHEEIVQNVKELVLDELGDTWLMKEIGDGEL